MCSKDFKGGGLWPRHKLAVNMEGVAPQDEQHPFYIDNERHKGEN